MNQALMRMLALLTLTLTLVGAGAWAQTSAPEAQAQARALLRELAAAQDFRSWFEQRRTGFTPAQAEAMDRIAADAIGSGHHSTALMAASLAALMHRHLQQPEPALRSALVRLQLLFAQAESEADYTRVVEAAQGLVAEGQRAGHAEPTFQAAVVAADAAFFGSRAPDVAPQRKEHPLASLHALEQAYATMPPAPQRAWFERLVSLTAAVTNESRVFLDRDAIAAARRALARRVEAVVPADFAYTQSAVGDLRKTLGTARALAELSYRDGQPALGSARLALASQRATVLADPETEIGLLLARFDGERRAGAQPQALRTLRDAAWRRAQALRSGYRSGSGRIWAAQRSDTLFGDMLQGELEDRSVPAAEVFARVESLKARMLLDRLAAPGGRELRNADTQALERQLLAFSKASKQDTSITLDEMRLVSRLAGLDSFGDEGGQRGVALARLENLYAQAGAGYGAAAEGASLAAVQKSLARDEALIEYVIPHHALHPAQHLWLMWVTADAVKLVQVRLDEVLGVSSLTGRMSIDGQAPVDSSALGNLIVGTRSAIRTADEKGARQRLAQLHRLLIAPLQAQGLRPEDWKRLLIVPHGVLHAVPFAALLDEQGRHLITKTEIVVAPSASVWQRLVQRRTQLAPALVLANPSLGSRGIADLPFAAQEGQAVAQALAAAPAHLYPGARATMARLQAEAPAAGIVHLATHGEFPDESAASEHALWLADESGQGVTLTAGQVRALRLPATRLVVLSVCNGGLYRIGPSDEPYGLVPAFLEAGAANVMGTLWPLDDQFGRDFMIEYYRHLPTRGVAGALRQASLRFIGEDEFLRKWAAFVLVGSGR